MDFQRKITELTKYIPYLLPNNSAETDDWKNNLLLVLLSGLVILGPFAYIPASVYAIKTSNWFLLALNTFVFAAIYYTAFSKKLSSEWKLKISIGVFYLLGNFVLLLLGPFSSGFIWLFIFVILASIFYGYKGIFITEIMSFVSLLLLSLPIFFQWEFTPNLNTFEFSAWMVNIVIFSTVSLFTSGLLSEIITNIDNSLRKEQKIIDLLQENQKSLAKEKQRAEEADMLKSKFLANMSHEIRTPLNSILGFTGLMAEPGLDQETLDEFNNVVKLSGEQLMRIINDIIDISKIESNQLNIYKKTVDVYKNLNEIIRVERKKIESLGKKLLIQMDVDLNLTNLYLETDEMRFKQILSNLIDNSIKYSKEGIIKVGYRLVGEQNNPALEFFVKDRGRGIPENALNKIFDRFSQAENIEFHEGTGLGLSIVKGLLDLLGGEIKVESKLGIGSTFSFTLPYNGEIITGCKVQTEKSQFQIPNYLGKTIYIAEDDNTSFYYLKEIFKPTNAAIEHAVNGKKLLDLINKKIPDIILLDINMPVMNGFDAIHEIRKNYNGLSVIAQTAFAMAEEKQKCLELGCNDYISKPIKKNELFKLVDQHIAQ